MAIVATTAVIIEPAKNPAINTVNSIIFVP